MLYKTYYLLIEIRFLKVRHPAIKFDEECIENNNLVGLDIKNVKS